MLLDRLIEALEGGSGEAEAAEGDTADADDDEAEDEAAAEAPEQVLVAFTSLELLFIISSLSRYLVLFHGLTSWVSPLMPPSATVLCLCPRAQLPCAMVSM